MQPPEAETSGSRGGDRRRKTAVGAGDAGGPTCLVVMADESLGDMLAWALELEGYVSQAARDGREALKIAEKITPDLVLLDAALTRTGGSDLVASLRQRCGAKTRIIEFEEPSDIDKALRGL